MPAPKNSKNPPPVENTIAIDIRLLDLEHQIDRTRSLFEQFFAGVLKTEPKKEFEALDKLVRSFKTSDLKTTASRFRFQNIQQRFLTHRNHWEKTLKQIEEGTFKRDLFLLKHKAPKKNETTKVEKKSEEGHLDKLYSKFVELSQGKEKIPAKEKFLIKIETQIQKLREKNPGKKVEVKLQRNKEGKLAVNIALK